MNSAESLAKVVKPLEQQVADLLMPIRPEQPAGDYVRDDILYDQIDQARWQDERVVFEKNASRNVDWYKVAELCSYVLSTKSKDLQVVAWLVQAWVRLYSGLGLYHGFKLLNELVNRFWPEMYPRLEEGVDFRLVSLEWLDGKLVYDLDYCIITYRRGSRPYVVANWLDHRHALNAKSTQTASKNEAKGGPGAKQYLNPTYYYEANPNQIRQAVLETEVEFFREQEKYLTDTHNLITELNTFLTNHSQSTAPSFIELLQKIQVLQQINDWALQLRQGSTAAAVVSPEKHKAEDLAAQPEASDHGNGKEEAVEAGAQIDTRLNPNLYIEATTAAVPLPVTPPSLPQDGKASAPPQELGVSAVLINDQVGGIKVTPPKLNPNFVRATPASPPEPEPNASSLLDPQKLKDLIDADKQDDPNNDLQTLKLTIRDDKYAYELINNICQVLHERKPQEPLPQIIRYLIKLHRNN